MKEKGLLQISRIIDLEKETESLRKENKKIKAKLKEIEKTLDDIYYRLGINQ